MRFSGRDRNWRGRWFGALLRGVESFFRPMVRTVGKAVQSKTVKVVGNAIKEQGIEQWLNLVLNAVRGRDLVEELQGEEEEFRNGDVKSNDVKSSRPLKLSRCTQMYQNPSNVSIKFRNISHPELEMSLNLSGFIKEVCQLPVWQIYKEIKII